MKERNVAEGRVEVLFFSILRERTGEDRLVVPVPEPTTGTALLDAVERCFPVVKAYRATLRLAVNQEYVDSDAVIYPGDEVALITPVSGG